MRIIIIASTILLLTVSAHAESALFGPNGDTTSDVAWLYELPLTVYETISYAGNVFDDAPTLGGVKGLSR